MLYFCTPNQKIWPVRLGVRTSGFHPGNRGSIPLRATIKIIKKAVKTDVCSLRLFLKRHYTGHWDYGFL